MGSMIVLIGTCVMLAAISFLTAFIKGAILKGVEDSTIKPDVEVNRTIDSYVGLAPLNRINE